MEPGRICTFSLPNLAAASLFSPAVELCQRCNKTALGVIDEGGQALFLLAIDDDRDICWKVCLRHLLELFWISGYKGTDIYTNDICSVFHDAVENADAAAGRPGGICPCPAANYLCGQKYLLTQDVVVVILKTNLAWTNKF